MGISPDQVERIVALEDQPVRTSRTCWAATTWTGARTPATASCLVSSGGNNALCDEYYQAADATSVPPPLRQPLQERRRHLVPPPL